MELRRNVVVKNVTFLTLRILHASIPRRSRLRRRLTRKSPIHAMKTRLIRRSLRPLDRLLRNQRVSSSQKYCMHVVFTTSFLTSFLPPFIYTSLYLVILASASEKLQKALNKEVEILNYMVKEASDEREAEKAGIETSDQIQAVLALDRAQLIKADKNIETQQAAEGIKAYQHEAMLTGNEKLEGEEFVLAKFQEEVDVVTGQLEILGTDEASSQQRQALQERLDARKADLLATKEARDAAQDQIRR